MFPRILRETRERDATLLFIDESGFLLTPTVRRTLAPRGKRPVLPAWQRHDRIRALSGIARGAQAPQSEWSFEVLPDGLNVSAAEMVAFRKDVRREVPGPLTVLWDRLQLMGSQARRLAEGS